jgi:hypothetical protein
MEHTEIVSAAELERYAETRDSESVIPELISTLITTAVPEAICRIPYGDLVNQPGWDGLVETENGFLPFVPARKSYWEIGTGANPQKKATEDFKKRTDAMDPKTRGESSYVFVTPRRWAEPNQSTWIATRQTFGWHQVRVLDSTQLADWLRQFPAIGKWLLKTSGLIKATSGFSTPSEHWENLQQLCNAPDPPLPARIFLLSRDKAITELERIFRGEINRLFLAIEDQQDAEDFVAAFIQASDPTRLETFANRCLFIRDADTWLSMVSVKTPHVLVAHPKLDLESEGEQLLLEATKRGHRVVVPVSGAWMRDATNLIPLRGPSAASLETTLKECGYTPERARTMASAGTLNLAALKRFLLGLGDLPPYATWANARILALAGLLGRWSGENEADRAAVEGLVGKAYGEWIAIARDEALRAGTPLTQRNEMWKVMARDEAWVALGPKLSNDDLDRFQQIAVKILSERDPRLELPEEDRLAAGARGVGLSYSAAIRQGVAETLALLGSKPSALSSCSLGKPEFVAAQSVRELLHGVDWNRWASLDRSLPLLAEASPSQFLDCVEGALRNPPESPFVLVFGQEGTDFGGGNYISGLLWALETLAWSPDYLLRAVCVLGDLAAIDPGGRWANRPANSLVDILLPWHPQTCASIPKRKAAVQLLLREHPPIGWKLLNALLPTMHGSTSGTRKPVWRNFVPSGWPESVGKTEYWEQVTTYADLAVETAAADPSRLAELIDRLPELPREAHSRVLAHLGSDSVKELSEERRLPLWEALIDLVAKHRKFAKAQWAMPPEIVDRIEKTAAQLAPGSDNLRYRRVFSERDFDLYDAEGDFEQQRKALDSRRQEIVKNILTNGGIKTVIEFARQVDSPAKVGQALGLIKSDSVDAALLPNLLTSSEKHIGSFVGGFVWTRYWSEGRPWVDVVLKDSWTINDKASFLALLPFDKEAWTLADAILGDKSQIYWERVNTNPWTVTHAHLPEAADKLLQYGRANAAIGCLYILIHSKIDFPPALAVRTLIQALSGQLAGIDQNMVTEVIQWLQNNPHTNRDDLFQIEWQYLPLLRSPYSEGPKILEERIATDPKFFSEVIATVFRSDKTDASKEALTDAQINIGRNAFHLLYGWKTVPGTGPTGTFDGVAFGEWLSGVKMHTQESGHFPVAMSQVGQVLAHAPADTDGLWIHRAVAKELDANDGKELRSGFAAGLFNLRGVHGFSKGAEELELANHYREKAEALDKEGFARVAGSVREVSESYKRDAVREAQRDPFEQ